MLTGRSVVLLLPCLAALGCGEEAADRKTEPGYDASLILDAGSDAPADADAAAEAAVDAGPDAPVFEGPETLSATGLYIDIVTRTLAPGVIPFEVRYPVWHDGATSLRYLALPPGTTIDTSYMDGWKFPIGTKAWKQYSVDGKPIETRYLQKQQDGLGGWLMVSYVWNDQETEASPVPAGLPDARGTTHDVPDQGTCTLCHNGVSDGLIGVSAIQLSQETGGGTLSQLIADQLLSQPPAGEFPVPGDGVVEDALGYLHGNCGHCHNDTNWLAQMRVIRFHLTVDATTPEQTPAYLKSISTPMNHVVSGTKISIVPGSPADSQVFLRMGIRGLEAMPPYDTEAVDPTGIATISEWIMGLP